MGYSSASDVSALCGGLIPGETAFSTSTSPTLKEVDRWITSGCGIIETNIAGWGYNVPVASGTALYDWLRDINTYWAAAHAELSRMNIVVSPGERTRGHIFEGFFWKNLEQLSNMDLSLIGAEVGGTSRTTTSVLYAGGISVSDKNSYATDSDRVTPRFSRGQFDFPDTLRPDEQTTAS